MKVHSCAWLQPSCLQESTFCMKKDVQRPKRKTTERLNSTDSFSSPKDERFTAAIGKFQSQSIRLGVLAKLGLPIHDV